MNKTDFWVLVAGIVLLGLGLSFCLIEEESQLPVANQSKLTQHPEDTIRIISPAQTKGIDTAEFDRRVRLLAHDSIPKPWQVFSIYPEEGALLPFYRIVAMYGNFYSVHMGILGKVPESELLDFLQQELEVWTKADTLTPTLPAIHYIAVSAQNKPGKDQTYRLRMPENQVNKAIQLARKIQGVTFLDVQVGHSTVQAEVPLLEKYLLESDVHLALDPEWSMKDGSVPGTKIGTLDAADISFAVDYLTELVKKHQLPPKILVIHRFARSMITNHQEIKPTPQVQVVINMDGFGFPAKKVDSYRGFVGGMPIQFTGMKLFYIQDKLTPPYRLMTPEEILALYPKPIYIQYQ